MCVNFRMYLCWSCSCWTASALGTCCSRLVCPSSCLHWTACCSRLVCPFQDALRGLGAPTLLGCFHAPSKSGAPCLPFSCFSLDPGTFCGLLVAAGRTLPLSWGAGRVHSLLLATPTCWPQTRGSCNNRSIDYSDNCSAATIQPAVVRGTCSCSTSA